jgi:hypothetical protein
MGTSTTHLAPASHSDMESVFGHAYAFLGTELELALMEKLDVLQLGLVRGVGDLAGSGSDTVRLRAVDGVGYAEAMTAMASETDAIVSSGMTSIYDEVTIARYGLAKEETYQHSILQDAVSLEMLKMMIPDSYLKTLRQQMAVAGSGIVASSGSTGTALNVDSFIDAVTAYNETEGAGERDLLGFFHPESVSDLIDSLRNEPAFQNSVADFNNTLGARRSMEPLELLNVMIRQSHDVQQASSAHQNFLYERGAIVWATSSTIPIRVSDPDAMYLPELGLIIQHKDVGEQAYRKVIANGWFGVGLRDSEVYFQRRVLGIDD